MPAIVTCRGKCCEQHWNVGSDDFVVPAAIAIVVGLFNFSLISAVLIAFYYIPTDLPSLEPSCRNVTYSPLLYGPLLALAAVEVCFILNEGVILIVSARGPIYKQTKAFMFRQRFIPYLIYVRIVLAVLELFAIIASLVGVFHPVSTSVAEDCSAVVPRLRFARAVVILQVVSFALFLVKVCLYTDPLGCSTPGLLERLNLLDDTDARGSLLLAPSDATDSSRASTGPGSSVYHSVSVDAFSAAKEVNVWRHRNKLLDITSHDINKVTKVHNDTINRKKYERRLRALFCCLGVRGQRSRGVALEDLARGLYTVFSEMDIVLSDVIAGFSLLGESQSKKKEEIGEIALVKKFRMVTFKMMSRPQRIGLNPAVMREDHCFDFTNVQNQLLFEDLVHYMQYAMGVYGWPLHIFDNLGCGLCELCTVTCCRFRCLHKRVKDKEFNKDNCCMCGVGTLRLQTGIPEEDILYVSFQNKIYLAPFIVCLDHKMKSVVVCVRGTLSLKDTLTDMSFSPIHRKVEGIKETYIHGGMYRAALGIVNTLTKHEILKKAFEQHKDYQLVVTGHSLGAGVASILSLLLKQMMKYSDQMMRCYAFSPPGALFSFPLAEYSSNFITSVVLGNDIVPRITLRGLLHLKYSVKHLLDHSERPKYQILCKTDTCATLCECFQKSKETVKLTRERSLHYRHSGRDRKGDDIAIVIDDVGARENGHGQRTREDSEYFSTHGGSLSGPDPTQVPLRKDVGGGSGATLERDDSVEWMVFDEGGTTASIRHKVFERSASIEPSSLPSPTTEQPQPNKSLLSRFFSQRPQYRRESSIAHSLASQIKQAVSLDLDEGVLSEGVIQGTTDDPYIPSPQQAPRSARVTHTRVKTGSVEEDDSDSSTLSQSRVRKNSDPTPGGIIDSTVPKLLEHCRVDEHKAFMPFFLPGRVLHIQVRKSESCCGIDDLTVMEVNRENLCVILIDNGIVDDHLPNHVLSALKDCRGRFMVSDQTHDREAIKDSRRKTASLIGKIRNLSSEDSVCKVDGFKFMGASPMQEPTGGSHLGGGAEGSGLRGPPPTARLRKQASFEDSSSLHPPRGVLTRISECVDEDATSATNVEVGVDEPDTGFGTGSTQVLVQADVNESAFLDEGEGAGARVVGGGAKIPLPPEVSVESVSTHQEKESESNSPPMRTQRVDIDSASSVAGSESETPFQHQNATLASSVSDSENPFHFQLKDVVSDSNISGTSPGHKLIDRRNVSKENLRLKLPSTESVTSL